MRIINYSLKHLFIIGLLLAGDIAFAKPSKVNKKEELAETKAQLGLQFFRIGDMRSALSNVNEAVQLDSRSVTAWLARAQIYQAMEQPTEVERSFQRAFSTSKYVGEVSNNYGWYLCQNNQVAKSIGFFDKALSDRTYTSPHVALMNKGICLSLSGKYEEANSILLESVRMSPRGFFYPYRELAQNSLAANDATQSVLYFEEYLDKTGVNDGRKLGASELLLGVKIGRLAGRHEWVGRYISLLRQDYPVSKEFQEVMSGNR